MRQRYWEDIEAGEIIPLGTAGMSRDAIVAFASEFDPQQVHLDEEAAKNTLLRAQAASGWHTCVVVNQLFEAAVAECHLTLMVAGAEDIRWRKPVRPGDSLSGRVVILEKAECACSRDAGTCRAVVEVTNQCLDVVASWHTDCIVSRRGKTPRDESALCPLRRVRPPRVPSLHAERGIKFFDDVVIGDAIDLGGYTFDDDRVAGFWQRYQPAQFHPTDPCGDAGRELANDWHVVSAWMQCIVHYYRRQANSLRQVGSLVPQLGPAAGVKHLRWPVPVKVGETIFYRTWAERKIEIAARDDWGLLIAGAEGVNVSGQIVVSFYPQMLLQRSPGKSNT